MVIVSTLLMTIDCHIFTIVLGIVASSIDFLVVHWEAAKIEVMTMDNGSSITEVSLCISPS